MKNNKLLILIPTYNEALNVLPLFEEISAQGTAADFLFVDDNSPDGTGKIIENLKKEHANVFVIHRSGKNGIGSAHLDGISWAYKNNYRTLITMDCDFSHPPSYIPEFFKFSADHDVVIGSRYKQKGSLQTWNLFRKILTHTGHFLTYVFLGISYDATGAFRVYRLDKIPVGTFDLVASRGYSFFFESLFILHFNKHSIKEVPMFIPARVYGHSKMKFKDAKNSFLHLVHIFVRKYLNRRSFIYSGPAVIEKKDAVKDQQRDWDDYWSKKKSVHSLIYDSIAVFYRKMIIKRSLNHYIRKYFKRESSVLHAGCGSGQVDVDISGHVTISALDISMQALKLYKKTNVLNNRLLYGSLFNMPVEDKTFDGIYNLGVMEHFTEDEIFRILGEFRRVLKPDGLVIIFWPLKYGLSTMFLNSVHFILNNVFKAKISLRPDEITLARSRAQISNICARSDFRVLDYHAGIGDLFTHAVVVLSNNDKQALKRENIKVC